MRNLLARVITVTAITTGVIAGMLLVSGNAFAEALYVTDKISVDVYSNADGKLPANGKPIKSLSSGAIVNVLARENGYSKIRTSDDVEGWIESKYLSNEKPTQFEYLQLMAKYNSAEQKIQDYQTRLVEMQELRKEAKTVDWLRNRLTENSQTEEALRNKLKVKDIAIAELRITTANLQNQLDTTLQQLDILRKSASTLHSQMSLAESEESSSFYRTNSSTGFYTWLVLSLAVTLIIGILMGFVLIDYNARKKHGDFKLN